MAGWRESLRKRTGMITVEIILQFSLRGQKKARKRGKGKWVPFSLSPIPLPFPLLPIPYPFRRLLLRLIRVCHNLVCAACAKNFEGWKLLLLYFLWTVFLVVRLTMVTFYRWRPFDRLLYSFLCFLQTIVYRLPHDRLFVIDGDLLTTGLHQPMVLIGCAGVLGTIITIPSRSVTKWLSWDKG